VIQFVLLHLLDSSIRYLVGYVHEADLPDEVVPSIGFLLAHLLRRDVLNSDSTVSNFLSLPMVVDIHVAEFHLKASEQSTLKHINLDPSLSSTNTRNNDMEFTRIVNSKLLNNLLHLESKKKKKKKKKKKTSGCNFIRVRKSGSRLHFLGFLTTKTAIIFFSKKTPFFLLKR
jgi:hypothetical protein